METLTLPQLYEIEYAPTELLGRAAATIAQYATAVSHWSRVVNGVPVPQITEKHLAAVAASLLASGDSPATVNKTIRHLRPILRFARRKRLLAHVPRIKRIPEPQRLPEAWTSQEFFRILEAARLESGSIAGIHAAAWWTSFLLGIYDSGYRVGEALSVETANLSLENGTARVKSSKTRRERLIRFHAQTLSAIRLIYDGGRLLIWPWPFVRRTLYRRFAAICQRAGVRYGQANGGLFHRIRRTSGTLVEAAGGDGSRHLDNGRAVFERFYRDPRVALYSQLELLPRPTLSSERQLTLF